MTASAIGRPAVADPGSRDAAQRLSRLLDPGSLSPLREPGATGVHTARGLIEGAKAVAFCTDATVMGGALGAAGCDDIVAAIDTAVRERCPVIGIWHCGGARIDEGVRSLEGVGRVFAAIVRASGRVPQLSVVVGPAAGGAAYGPALTDLVIMAPDARLFVTGPDVVRDVTGEDVTMADLGGPEPHGRRSGVCHVRADSEDDAYVRARRIATLLGRPGVFDPRLVQDEDDLRQLLPARPNRAYDVKPLLRRILDGPATGAEGLEEVQAAWAPNMVVGFGRLGGRTVGVVANNPLRKGGCLDSLSAEKAARFVRMCDSFGVPLVVVVDVPGFLPGVGQEWDGVIRRGAKLLHAFAEAVVPRVTLVTRKSYGGAYVAMNSRSLGATAVFAWPEAETSVMGAEPAVRILYRRRLAAAPPEEREALRAALVAEHQRTTGGLHVAVAQGAVDEVIDPARTRRTLAEALAGAPAGRGSHGNIPL
ncbi:acetyl-CoA/propionyl-CoA carboxylase carboxyl transferase subunit [Thermomonospora echinospora]|uniref:Acetyl-CoA/propionyl-CoA carboxylase carboxyl transferase subunit n=1 Tax=Thermomonospora echinospora TaxID=1992 RepID=A0A1H5TQD9_9ACTN|nr:carboxyl transferase domain-containing protein [Thermomonospora echinospora]SEF65082.1 acetyl-CoA/propionyl-CoA carboxylase carboxyl transferase subunit [Thermomonospora echinospora]